MPDDQLAALAGDSPQAFAHHAELHLAPGGDPRAPGAAVTAALCGQWEHAGACRWPHNNEIDVSATPAHFRTLFVASVSDEAEVRQRLDGALRHAGDWTVASAGARAVLASEEEIGQRLAATWPRGPEGT